MGLSQMLYKKQKAQPFATQVYKFKPKQKKKPRKRAKKSIAKEGWSKSLFLELYLVMKNWSKTRSKGTNRGQFFLFSCGCRAFQY